MSTKRELLALWKKEGKDGKTYFTGKLGQVPVVAFPNDSKKNPKEPDLKIFVARDEQPKEP